VEKFTLHFSVLHDFNREEKLLSSGDLITATHIVQNARPVRSKQRFTLRKIIVDACLHERRSDGCVIADDCAVS
jgi:ribosomal protein L14